MSLFLNEPIRVLRIVILVTFPLFISLYKTALSCVLTFDTQTTLSRSELQDCLTLYFESPRDQSGLYKPLMTMNLYIKLDTPDELELLPFLL